MPPKRPLLQGDDGGDGHSWKVVKAQKAVNVFYGKGFNSTFTLKKEDQTTAPTEQLVLQRIAEHRDAKRKQQDDDEGGGGGKKAKKVDSPQKQPLSLPKPRAACRRPARRKTAECRRRSHI